MHRTRQETGTYENQQFRNESAALSPSPPNESHSIDAGMRCIDGPRIEQGSADACPPKLDHSVLFEGFSNCRRTPFE